MRTAYGMSVGSMETVFSLLTVLLAASYCQAAGVDQTGVNSTELQVVASQPMMISCDAPSPLGKYDSYCEGLRADYFLLPKQKNAPSLTGLSPNTSAFVTSLNDTAAALSFKGVDALIAAKKYSFAVRYTGVLFYDIAGRYDFFLKSAAGTRLTINGNTVTLNQGSNASSPITSYNLAQAGYLPIELVFFNENSVPSLEVQWTGPGDDGVQTVIEGSSIQFNCSHLQNNTNSMPPKTASFCPGLSAVYYSQWTNSSFATATGGVATYAIYEQGLNHWSTTTTPAWSRLPASLKSNFSGRYNGQLWIPLPGTYTFKLSATNNAALFVGNNKILNSTAINGVAQAKTVTYTFATAGYAPLGLNFLSRKTAPLQAGVLRLAWKGPNSPAFKVVYGFSHPCSTFVACSNSTTAGALPAEVVGTPPAGTTIESASAVRTALLATYVPTSNVTFTLGFPALNAEDPSVEDVSYFVREAVANAAGLRLESVWTVPTLDDDGNVVFPLGAYFKSVLGAQRFYDLVNLRPQTIFSSSAGLYDFYPITVSSPDLGTRVASAQPPLQPARPMARLVSASGEDDDIPLPATPLPTPTSTPNATVSNTTTTGDIISPSPSPTAAPTATPTAAAPEATFTPVETLISAVPATPTPTPVAPAPAPGVVAPAPAPVAGAVAPAPAPEGTALPVDTAIAPVPAATMTPVPVETSVAPAPAMTPVPPTVGLVTPVALAPAPEGTALPVDIAPAPASEGAETPVPTAVAPAPEGLATPIPAAAAPAPVATATPVAVDTSLAPAPEATATPVPTDTLPAPAPEATATPVPTDSLPAPAPEATATPVPTDTLPAPAPAPEAAATTMPSIMGLATPVAPAPAPVPADVPAPIPTAVATPLAPSPAPAAPETLVPKPTATDTATTAAAPTYPDVGQQAPAPAPSLVGSSPRLTVPVSYGTPAAYGPIGATPAQGPAPGPALDMPASAPLSAATPSPMAYSPVTAVSTPGPTTAPAGAPQSSPSPVPTPYPALTPTPTRSSPYVTPTPVSPTAYSPPPSPYSPVTMPVSSPTPPASPPSTSPTITSQSPYASSSPITTAPTPYASSPQTGSQGTPPGSSPRQDGVSTYPFPPPVPSSLPGTLFGPPGSSPILGTFGHGLSTPPSEVCAYASNYYVPYPGGVGGYMVPCPRPASSGSASPTPYGSPNSYASSSPGTPGYPTSPITSATPGYSPSPATPGYSPSPATPGYSPSPATPGYSPSPVTAGSPGYPAGSPVVSPSPAKLPVYYGPPIACPPGTASCRSGPYAYYAPQGPSSPAAPQPYFSPLFGSPRTPGSPRGVFAPAPAPAPVLAPAFAPAQAPGPSAQCACDPTDATPRSVKIEVLSTSYNSTTSDAIKFNAYLTFSHPARSLNSSQVRVFTRQPSDNSSGTVTDPGTITVLQPISQNCAFYSLKGYVSESNPFAVNSTSIFLAAGGNILDACGSPFNVTVTRVEQSHRLQGLLYATGVAYSEEAGVLLDGNVLHLALAFTDAVPRLSANMFSVTGPPQMTNTELERVDGSNSYFTFSVTLPQSYYGSVKVSMNKAGRNYLTSINPAAVAPASLTLSRADPVTQGSLVNSTRTRGL